MRYIKSINEYYNEEYYTIIDKEELRELYANTTSVDKLSMSVLNQFLDDNNIDYDVFNNNAGYQIMIDLVYNEKIMMYPCSNDWFLCTYSYFMKKNVGNILQSFSNIFRADYKCDQIEGVIRLIKDIISEKKEEPKKDSSNHTMQFEMNKHRL